MLSRGGLIGAAGGMSSAGGVILVGSSAAASTIALCANGGNYLYATSDAITASNSGTPASISIYLGATTTATGIVLALYTGAGALVAQTVSGAISANSWNTLAVTGSPGVVTSGQTYKIGVVGNGYWYIGSDGLEWRGYQYASAYPAVPGSLSGGDNINMGNISAYVSS